MTGSRLLAGLAAGAVLASKDRMQRMLDWYGNYLGVESRP